MVANPRGCLDVESNSFPFNVPWEKDSWDKNPVSKKKNKTFLIAVMVGKANVYDFFRTKKNLRLFYQHFDKR